MTAPRGHGASMRPRVILLTGAPGSGKSTLGRELGAALRIPFIARDDVRGGMTMTAGAWRDALERLPSSDAAVDAFLDVVELTLQRGVSCIAEYVFRTHKVSEWERLMAAGDAVVIVTRCSNAESRLVERNTADRLIALPAILRATGASSVAEHTEAKVERMRAVASEMMTDFSVPTLAVDTTHGYDPALETIIDFAVH